ncbi:SDR family oxidoreductase [Gordonia insulae]|uniref:NAD-dependent epimerase/dehydratase domain-containing protein n=1 Tax=Gordonia insulae TaxID=2420509 RepID=A0A3G8JNC1_9ACTN|nr:SDR family oxidoreductase [Gordonia insulae]AZG46072.1 hypothetical protein D7316_02672 [Gordonia insulae]
MRVFVTGASGHIGAAVIPELLSAGHTVVGLARSDGSAAVIAERGAEVRRGDLDDLAGLADAAADADGVIHLAFKHDSMAVGDMAAAGAADLAAVDAIGDALAGTGKPFVGTSGTLLLAGLGITGRPGTEADVLDGGYRIDSENAVVGFADRGVRSSVLRLPPSVHSDLDRQGFVRALIGFARDNGFAGYLGDGSNRWPAVHTRDAARLYRLALESAPAGTRLHAVGDEGVPFRDIAEAIGRGIGMSTAAVESVDADRRFGFLAGFAGLDNPTSADITREVMDWKPEFPGLIDDIDAGHYFV